MATVRPDPGEREGSGGLPGPPAGPEAAAAYLRRRGWDRILRAMQDRYVSLGRVGGFARLPDPTASELAAVRDLLGRRPRQDRGGALTLPLRDLDAALRGSAFACGLVEALAAYFGTRPVARQEAKAADEEAFGRFLAACGRYFPPPLAGRWWEGVRRAAVDEGAAPSGPGAVKTLQALRRHWARDAAQLQRALERVGAALGALPRSPAGPAPPGGQAERLAVFAGRLLGDPHALDPDQPAGRLLERALEDLHPDPQGLLAGLDTRVLRRDALLREAGLLRDDLSSTVLVWGLRARLRPPGGPATGRGGALPPLARLQDRWGRKGARSDLPPGLAVHLPLREVDRLEVSAGSCPTVFVVENPVVFGELVDALGGRGAGPRARPRPARAGELLPVLVCTSGQLSLAAVALLEMLVRAGATLYYSGDFDEAGLAIAAGVRRRFGERCVLWRYTAEDYRHACRTGRPGSRLDARAHSRLARYRQLFPGLVEAMGAEGRRAYQEALVDRLAQDVAGS